VPGLTAYPRYDEQRDCRDGTLDCYRPRAPRSLGAEIDREACRQPQCLACRHAGMQCGAIQMDEIGEGGR
jgi:hypothetical protein